MACLPMVDSVTLAMYEDVPVVSQNSDEGEHDENATV
jgi:hypothetical protein